MKIKHLDHSIRLPGFGKNMLADASYDERCVRTARPKRGDFIRCASLMSLLALFILVSSANVFAAGEEFTRKAADLVVTVDGRWAGCGSGGYYPLRIQVLNRGLDRNLTFRFSSINRSISAIPNVQRSVRVAQNSTVHLTLSVPCVGPDNYGKFEVFQEGRLIKQLTNTLNLTDNQGYGASRPSLLVISPHNVDASYFESAVAAISSAAGTSTAYGYYSGVTEDHQVVNPDLLPDVWIDYSGLDLVAIPLKTLAGLTVEHRAALLKWVHCGGNLIIYDVGTTAAQSQELARLLETNAAASPDSLWRPANLAHRKVIDVTSGATAAGAGTVPQPVEETTTETVGFVWPESAETFFNRDLMWGKVSAFGENPFPGSPHDWAWFLKSVPAERRTWAARHGINARQGSDEFLKFLIPSVKGVPVLAFLLLITLFTIIIGPLNYLWLWRRRRLYLLVLTIPAIALVTSVSLFAYSAVAHGFSTKSRSRSLTLIDQPSNTAISASRIALYSGLAPTGGLHFSPETAVSPIWPENNTFESGSVDWTEQQHLSGWLRSRTRTQFLTVSHRDERGRLRISSPQNGRLHVENGLEWELDALVVSDASGQLFYGTDLAAGEAMELTPITQDQRTEFTSLLQQYPLVPPETRGHSGDFFDWNFDLSYIYGGMAPVYFESSLMEKRIASLQQLKRPGGEFAPSSYAAVVGENPGIELGLESTHPRVSLHVLMGNY